MSDDSEKYEQLLGWYNTLEDLRRKRSECSFFDFSGKRDLDEQIRQVLIEINVLRAQLGLSLD